jgi:hypothetical protein
VSEFALKSVSLFIGVMVIQAWEHGLLSHATIKHFNGQDFDRRLFVITESIEKDITSLFDITESIEKSPQFIPRF